MTPAEERVVVLEVNLAEMRRNQDEILRRLDSISSEMTRYKGFVGGIAFLLSGMWAVILLVRDKVFGGL